MSTAVGLGVGTVNIGPDDNLQAEMHVKKMFRLGADILVITEMGGRDKLVANLRAQFYAVVYSTLPNQGRIAVVAKPRFVVEKVEYVKVNDRKNVGKKGAGPDVAPDRWMPCVRVYDGLARRRYWVLGKHLIASQYIPVRDAEAETDITRTAAWISGHSLLGLFAPGDYNNQPYHPNFAPLRALLVNAAIYLGAYPPTHGGRHIDHVWFRAKRWLLLTSQRVVPINPKDHDGYIATFAVKVRHRAVAALAGIVRR